MDKEGVALRTTSEFQDDAVELSPSGDQGLYIQPTVHENRAKEGSNYSPG